MAILFLIVFVDLVGFGLLIPLLPFYVQRVGAGPELITIVLSFYSLAQFVAGPIWGRLSDRFGRKTILALTSVGLALSYVMLGYADSLTWLIVARIFGGLMGGNIGAAQAYVTDVTTPETRAKGMGMIGAAFGLGFIFGPAIGGLLSGGDVGTANFFLPAMTAAGITFAAAIGAMLFLKESLTPEIRARVQARESLAQRLTRLRERRPFLLLTLTGFLTVTGWALFETIFSLWANARFDYGPRQIGLLMAMLGIVGAFIQGGAIGPLTRRFGERRLLGTALVMLAIGYAILAVSPNLPVVLIAGVALAIGQGFFNPSITSLVSKQAGPHERGAVMGTYQGFISLSRVVGPMASGAVFARAGIGAPFLVGVALALPALWCLMLLSRHKAAV